MTRQTGRVRPGNIWSIVLAAGSGTRLRPLVSEGLGVHRPKQFCTFGGTDSLFRQAIDRASLVTSPNRVSAVLAGDHRQWWKSEVTDIPPENVVVQPCNRGTACGLLLPLVNILHRDPSAVVAVFPSDHFVENEETLATAVCQAVDAARCDSESVVLLGIEPDSPHDDLGWITPSRATENGVRAVVSFVEKPSIHDACRLMANGGLLNSFVFVARGLALLSLCERAFPGIVQRFGAAVLTPDSAGLGEPIARLYEGLPTLDLSRDVLQASAADLRVIPVPPCGWTDLGTPERVIQRALGPASPGSDVAAVATADRGANLPDLVLAAYTYSHRHADAARRRVETGAVGQRLAH